MLTQRWMMSGCVANVKEGKVTSKLFNDFVLHSAWLCMEKEMGMYMTEKESHENGVTCRVLGRLIEWKTEQLGRCVILTNES